MSTFPHGEQTYQLLLIDDDQDIHDLVEGLLQSNNINLFSAYNGDQALEIALREELDMILLDYEMPGMNGLQVLSQLRNNGVPDSIPVVFITGNNSHKILTACFQAGAADYIHKPFCAAEFRARTIAIMERQHMLRKFEHLAMHDPLTRLCNRASIKNKIQAAIDRSDSCNFAILFLDFDRFKLVNDSLGHDVGDQLLIQIADRLRAALRGKDCVGYLSASSTAARLGGDEFVVLLDDLREPSDAALVADRLIATLEDPYHLAGKRVCSTASIGVVSNVRAYLTADEVLRDADIAMYEAKSIGRGRCVLFDQVMHANAENRLEIENDLRHAITNEELVLEYQPILQLESGKIVGFEALVRWNHPRKGMLAPATFLPIAEESGLIVPLGLWVLDRACHAFANWQKTLGDDAPTSIQVNVSRKQLLRDLVEKVTITLKKYMISPEHLHLEITESQIMQNPDVAKATLNDLRRLGVKIEMDDFGTGHSSLSCLQEMPIDVLKLDQSLIRNMEKNRSFAALVHAVINFSKNLGMMVVGEGVETEDQLAMLQFMECTYGQGFLFAQPMPYDDVVPYLLRSKRNLEPSSLMSGQRSSRDYAVCDVTR